MKPLAWFGLAIALAGYSCAAQDLPAAPAVISAMHSTDPTERAVHASRSLGSDSGTKPSRHDSIGRSLHSACFASRIPCRIFKLLPGEHRLSRRGRRRRRIDAALHRGSSLQRAESPDAHFPGWPVEPQSWACRRRLRHELLAQKTQLDSLVAAPCHRYRRPYGRSGDRNRTPIGADAQKPPLPSSEDKLISSSSLWKKLWKIEPPLPEICSLAWTIRSR